VKFSVKRGHGRTRGLEDVLGDEGERERERRGNKEKTRGKKRKRDSEI
jgi:hypothetical protein